MRIGTNKRRLALPFASHPLSSLIRKLIEQTRYKRALIAHVAFGAVILNVAVASPSHAFDYKTSDSSLLAPATQTIITRTETAFQFPAAEPIGLSQGFHAFHPGVDIRAPRGSQVVSVADGTVIEVTSLATGYGHYVRIAHAGTLSTLYAHLDKVTVKVGENVHKGQQLGTIGTTGWSTGPHLHFEIHEGVSAINPAPLLGIN
jgi:murein DD-endopeptidase MepM/ murein hydrolase activator NlpD